MINEDECLIFLFGFIIQFVGNLTFLYSYIVSKTLLLYSCNKYRVDNLFVDTVQKSFSKATRSSIWENCG